jgi:hypothetical protein
MKKKRSVRSVIVLGSLLIASNVQASPYVGAGLSYINTDYQKADVALSDGSTLKDVDKNDFLENKLPGINIFFGYEFDNKVGYEISYTGSGIGEKTSNTGLKWADTGNDAIVKTEIVLDVVDLDAKYSYNVSNFKLFAAAGPSFISYSESSEFQDEGNTRLTSEEDETGFGVNGKIGVEVALNSNFALRSDMSYVKSYMDNVDSIMSYNAGVMYKFK